MDYQSRITQAQRNLAALQHGLARSRERGIVVLEGWDAAGKGGIVRRLAWALDPRYLRVHPIAAPDTHEAREYWLQRFVRRLPRAGRIAVFDRSWYGRVLVERIEGFASSDEWARAYKEINDFEEQLTEHGAVVLKFWLHLDQDEQLRRFREREVTPWKKHKITDEDWRNRERWADYAIAVNDMVGRTSTARVPWHLVAANDKRAARIEVLETFCDALEARIRASG